MLRALSLALVPMLLIVPTTTVHARPACADVLFLGARGSGQPAGGTLEDGGTGMGPQVHDVARRLVAELPGRTIDARAVDYPAEGVEVILVDPARYLGGLEAGVASVDGVLREQAARCPRQRIVLAGYSQGAMIMHRELQDLQVEPAARGILRRVDGAVLIADGDRRLRDHVTSYGTSRRGRGIATALLAASGSRAAALAVRLAGRVQSVCQDFDVICDYRPRAHTGLGLVQGSAVHRDGYDDTAAVRRATDAVAARVG